MGDIVEMEAALKVQCGFRQLQAKKTVHQIRNERKEAAVALRKAQTEAMNAEMGIDSKDPYYAAMNSSATKMSAMYRGRAARKDVAKTRAKRENEKR